MFPSLVSMSPQGSAKNTDLGALQKFDKLVPIIGGSMRETKSDGAKQAYMKLLISGKILYYEIAAIRIQTLIRQYQAKVRVRLIRHNIKLFLEITQTFCDRILEETALAMSLECSLGLIRSHNRYKILKAVVESEMVSIVDELFENELNRQTIDVVIETVTEATDYIANRRPKKDLPPPPPPKYNLILDLISLISDEAVDSMIRRIVVEAIQDEVREYLLSTYSQFVMEFTCLEVIFDLAKHILADEIILCEEYHTVVTERTSAENSDTMPQLNHTQQMVDILRNSWESAHTIYNTTLSPRGINTQSTTTNNSDTSNASIKLRANLDPPSSSSNSAKSPLTRRDTAFYVNKHTVINTISNTSEPQLQTIMSPLDIEQLKLQQIAFDQEQLIRTQLNEQYFPLHTHRVHQMLHGISNTATLPKTLKNEIDKAIVGMNFLTFGKISTPQASPDARKQQHKSLKVEEEVFSGVNEDSVV